MEEKKIENLSADERLLMKKFRSLNEEGQEKVLDYLYELFLAKTYKYQIEK